MRHRDVLHVLLVEDDPVVVLTTSTAEEDILDTYSLHADLYVSKPMEVSRFGEVITQLDHLFASVRVPTD